MPSGRDVRVVGYRSNTFRPLRLTEAFLGVFFSFWTNRLLIFQLVKREFEARFKGSVLGLLWAVLTPLFLLLVYTFVFSEVFKARWSAEISSPTAFALVLFSGLIAFNILSENLNAAPRLVLQNVSYIKKVVFPLEVLAWVSLLTVMVSALISALLLLVCHFIVLGVPPASALYIPIITIPLCLCTLGAIWFISSLGVFLRDLQHGIGIVTTILLFLSPIFYPLSAVPERVQGIIFLNPLTPIIEMIRGAVFFGEAPSGIVLAGSIIASWLFAAAGYWWFMRIKKGFADVV